MEINATWNFILQKDKGEIDTHEFSYCTFFQEYY